MASCGQRLMQPKQLMQLLPKLGRLSFMTMLFVGQNSAHLPQETQRSETTYFPLPTAKRLNMAFTAPESLEHGRVLEVIGGCNQKLLESVEAFDVYRDAATIGADYYAENAKKAADIARWLFGGSEKG